MPSGSVGLATRFRPRFGLKRILMFALHVVRSRVWPRDELDPTDPSDTRLDVRPWKEAEAFFCPSSTAAIPRRITNANWGVEDSARVSYEFFSVWFAAEQPPRITRL